MSKSISIIILISLSSCIFVPKWETSMKPKSIQKSDEDYVGPIYVHWIGYSRNRHLIIYARFINVSNGKETMVESQFCPPISENLNENKNFVNQWPCIEKPEVYLKLCSKKEIKDPTSSLNIIGLNRKNQETYRYCFEDKRKYLNKTLLINSGKFIFKNEEGSYLYYMGLPFAYLLDIVVIPLFPLIVGIFIISHGNPGERIIKSK